jgi:hypothetical protein
LDALGNLDSKKQQVDDLSTSINNADIDNVITQLDTTSSISDTQRADALAR